MKASRMASGWAGGAGRVADRLMQQCLMRACDVMNAPAITVGPDTLICARLGGGDLFSCRRCSRSRIPCVDSTLNDQTFPDHFDELRSEEHTSELQSHSDLVCRLLLE